MAKDGAKKKRRQDDAADLEPPLPPDGGWGWAVTAASFVTNLIVDGVCYTFGVILPELVDYFQTSKSKAALVGSMVPGVYLIVGPFVSALANKFGCKAVAAIGSLIAGVFFALSMFSTSIEMMIFTYGVMGGIGFGMMFLPSIVMVGHYFDKKRAMATGIAVCGSGIGTFIMAPVASKLVAEYGWKGTNLITGAIIFHCIACALIYRPLLPTRRKPAAEGGPPSAIMQNIIAEKKRNRTISTGSMDGTVITKDNRLVVAADAGENDAEKIGLQAIPESSPVQSEKVNDGSRTRTISTASRTSRGCPDDQASKVKDQLASPFVRDDIFYAGSVTKLDAYKASPDMATYIQSHTTIPGATDVDGSTKSVSKCSSICSMLLKMFDFSLLLSPTFIVVCLAGVLAFVGLYTPFVYVYEKAISQLNVEKSKASLILSILGIFNTLGRLGAGWLADRPWADPLIIHNVSAILAGVFTCLVSFIYSFELLCVYAALFGTFIAAFIALRSIVIVELLGIQKLTNAWGMTSLFQGFACLIGSPLSGAILDSTGSFVGPFMVSGGLIALGGVLCLPVRCISRWETNRQQKAGYTKANTQVA